MGKYIFIALFMLLMALNAVGYAFIVLELENTTVKTKHRIVGDDSGARRIERNDDHPGDRDADREADRYGDGDRSEDRDGDRDGDEAR